MLYHSLTCEQHQFHACWKLMTPCRSVNHINSEVASKKEQTFSQKLFSVTIDGDRIVGWEKDLDRVLVLFNVRF